MANVRPELSKKNLYYIPKHAFYAAYHYALQYADWKQEYEALSNSLKSTGEQGGRSSKPGNPTETTGMKRAELKTKMELIERTAIEADHELAEYILLGAINTGNTYNYLKAIHNIPCGRNQYYERRRRFYYLLSKKI